MVKTAITSFGAWLASERERQKLTQLDLAQLIQSHPAQVGRWESGGRFPGLPYFRAIILALKVDANEVLRDHVCGGDDVRVWAMQRLSKRRAGKQRVRARKTAAA